MVLVELCSTSIYSEDIPSEEVSRIMDKELLDEYNEYIAGKSMDFDYEIETIDVPGIAMTKRLLIKVRKRPKLYCIHKK